MDDHASQGESKLQAIVRKVDIYVELQNCRWKVSKNIHSI
jgi:hypothetical protein